MSSKRISLKRKHAILKAKSDNKLQFAPWVDDFSPSSVEELAVHKKKVSEVQLWIQKALSCNRNSKESSILILTGPPGVGKTACVNAVCNSLGVEMFVWSNSHQEKTFGPSDDTFFNMRDRAVIGETQAVAFSRFLLQSSKYSLYSNSKRIIVVEEFPNAVVRDPVVFHNIIRKYSVSCQCPAIFIISDNVRGQSVENNLFPKDLQLALKISNISFNPVAPTMLTKVLSEINNSSKVQSGYRQLTKAELASIASDSMGDIRNAINSMQFLCMSYFKKPLSVKSTSASQADYSSKRDTSFFLFHALGKILYCKRDVSLKCEKDLLPPKLKQFEKDPLISNPEEVYERTSISAEGFTLFLQENYIPFVEDVKVAFECSNWLSEADLLSASWSSRDIMNDYMVSVAARGLMFNLTPGTTGRRWRSLHKPQFYEYNSKQRRQLSALKYNFKGTSLSMRELQIDLVPFLRNLQPKHLNSAQLVLSKELGEMNVKRFTSQQPVKTLDEKDCFQMETDDSEIMTHTEDVDKVSSNQADPFSDEEIVIEEYDF